MVTGASAGIGREVCIDLSKAGCKVIAAARRVDLLNDLCSEINRLFPHIGELHNVSDPQVALWAVAVELDVSAGTQAIEVSAQKAWEAFGCIDALINNAGIRGGAKFSIDLSEQEWDDVMNINLKGQWLVSKFVCRLMRDAELGGSIINVSSAAGVSRGHLPGGAGYDSSKPAFNSLTKVLALELGRYNIRLNGKRNGSKQ